MSCRWPAAASNRQRPSPCQPRAPNDKRQIEPALEALARLPEALGAPETLLADSRYFSEANVNACAEAEIAPLITPGRERHHLSWKDRFAGAPPPPENPTPLEAMTHRLATPEGRQLYALRKQTPEPVFGIIKSAMGFRLERGLDKVTGEWNLVTLAWNIKRSSPCNTLEQAAGLRTSRGMLALRHARATNVLRALTTHPAVRAEQQCPHEIGIADPFSDLSPTGC